MRGSPWWSVVFALALLLSACAPAGPARDASRPGEGTPRTPKTLTIAMEGEPENLAMRMGDSANPVAGNLRLAVSQRLATYDDRGLLHPMLAKELPSQEKGTWIVRPDGTMQTTYVLKDGISWHDGVPLTPNDFVLAWRVSTDPDLPISDRVVANQISSIDTPNNSTLVIHWAATYPFAHAITENDLGPLPVHILEATYPADKERFQQLGYWTREYVGVGPYRVAEWEPGSHLVLRAYEGFYAGRARIDTIIVRFIENPPTAVANLLAGAIDGSIPRTIDFNQAMFIKGEWERAGKHPLAIVQPTHWRMMSVQFRDPKAREILDARTRRGLLHAIDRSALVDALLAGQTPVSDAFIPPDDPKWEWVKDAAIRYDFDPRRAQELLAEVGWRRGADGAVANAAGERVSLPLWTTESAQNEQEIAIIAEYWKRVGLNVEQTVLQGAQARDRRTAAFFPAFDTRAIPLTFENTLQRVYSGTCPTEGNRYSGTNVGCYLNPAMDQVIDNLKTAIEPTDQRRLYRDLIRVQTEDLPVLPLYFNVIATIFREGVAGVKGDTKPRTSVTWNVAEWDIQ